MTNKKGFTLVELLVVVGIIGILASIGVASLNSARQKARDAKRISDVKQMSTIIESEEGSVPNQVLATCNSAFAKTSLCNNAGDIATLFPKLLDPSTPKANGQETTSAVPCKDQTKAPCSYSIANIAGTAGATTADYQICFFLESGGAGLKAGLARVESGGILQQNCTIGVVPKKAAGEACTAGSTTECQNGTCKVDNKCP